MHDSIDDLKRENEKLRCQLDQCKQMEEALKKSEELYRLLADNITDLIWIMDMNFRYTYLSPSVIRQSGYTHDEAMGLTLEQTFTPESISKISQAFAEEMALPSAENKPRVLELEAYHKGGTRDWVEVVATFQKDSAGNPVGILGTTRNITKRKLAELKLEEALNKERAAKSSLEEEMRKRVEFTRILIHELKTPLTAVVASSGLLVSELPEGVLQKLAKNINRSTNDLNNRIDLLLDVARGELGMLKLNLTSVDISKLLNELAEEMGPAAQSRHQSLVMDVPRKLSNLRADEERLSQIIMNLLNNAFKYTPEKGTVTLKARESGGSLVVEVEDTGSGISEVDQQYLFNLYYRVEADKDRSRGLGVGLALCKTLVELHNGKIWMRSGPQKGSIFGFSIPINNGSKLK